MKKLPVLLSIPHSGVEVPPEINDRVALSAKDQFEDSDAFTQEMAEQLVECFREGFGLEEKDVVMNKPFAGGYITRTYGEGSLPWMQVEMNRSLYLSEPWFDAQSLTVQPQRLQKINQCFRKTLSLFFHS